jgi:CheY-like chemotaxis protein
MAVMDKLEQQLENALIMLVDDEPLNLKILHSMLTIKDYRTLLLTKGSEVFQSVIDNKPDLILLDVMLPDLGGYEVCKLLKSDPKTSPIPIIFLSGNTRTEDIINGLELGASDYVAKPFNMTELLARVETNLKLKFSTEQLIEAQQLKALNAIMVSQNHELNQLLTIIIGQSEILRTYLEEESFKTADRMFNALDMIEHSSWKMSEIIKKLKNIKQIKFTDYTANTEMLDLDKSTE